MSVPIRSSCGPHKQRDLSTHFSCKCTLAILNSSTSARFSPAKDSQNIEVAEAAVKALAEIDQPGDLLRRPTAGDFLIEAIVEAVALKLERMAGVQQRLMDVKDAAKYLGMTEDALRHKAGVDVPCVRIDGKLRFDRRELDRYIDRRRAKEYKISRVHRTHDGDQQDTMCSRMTSQAGNVVVTPESDREQ
jgi:hypothetical protein